MMKQMMRMLMLEFLALYLFVVVEWDFEVSELVVVEVK
jgi:hypothetical protein